MYQLLQFSFRPALKECALLATYHFPLAIFQSLVFSATHFHQKAVQVANTKI